MKTADIIGKNYFGHFTNTRVACRGIVIEDDRILLSYEKENDLYMLPGGGLEPGEDEAACCIRELAEETGMQVRLTSCPLELTEYYEDWRYVTRYFCGTIVGECGQKLTDYEEDAGLTPVWLPLTAALDIFSRHESYADTDEPKRGIYERELLALTEILGKKHILFLKQKAQLEQFLKTGAITKAQHDKSLHDLREKMGE